MPPSDINSAINTLVLRVARDSELLHQLEFSFLAEEREKLIAALHNLLPTKYHHTIKDMWARFMTYCK